MTWDGKELTERFAIDFTEEELERPHIMRFGARSLYASQNPSRRQRRERGAIPPVLSTGDEP